MLYKLGLLCVLLLISACSSAPVKKPVAADDFQGSELGQSGPNRVANLAMRDNLHSLESLLEKLYKRNPKQWQKTGAANYQVAMQIVMIAIRNNESLPNLPQQRGIAAINLSLDPGFQGDRAGTLIYGLGSMLVEAYGGRTELYLIHGLDAQQISNASHNLEVTAWMLGQRKNSQGEPLLLSNEISAQARNLSFEREFGKMIARLDLLAELNSEKYRRSMIDFGQSLVAGPFLQFLPVSAAGQAVQAAAP
ncbi:hypothetical protein HZU77_004560 [Neisseriaceae bacterium TC5R-5]|nr:hypothetical protein [Neisseriaceae bacterium TC5R-5]